MAQTGVRPTLPRAAKGGAGALGGRIIDEEQLTLTLKGSKGDSAYESYVSTTTDNPVLSEQQWVDSLKINSATVETIVVVTQEQYDSLNPKSDTTLYIIPTI